MLRSRQGRKPSINIIPLVDVLTVLLFFFLVTMQFKSEKTLNISIPEIKTAGMNQLNEKILISIDANEKLYLNQEPVDIRILEVAIEINGDLNANLPVLIMADETTELRLIAQIMDICRSHNLNKIRLQSR